MNTMKKVWIYKRAGIKGWWVGWYEISWSSKDLLFSSCSE